MTSTMRITMRMTMRITMTIKKFYFLDYYDYSKQSKIINNLLPFFWRNIYFFWLFSFVLPTEVILSAILLPIRSPVASAVFCTTLLEVVFAASIPVFVAVSINLLPYLSLNFLANDRKPYPCTYFLNFGSGDYRICIMFIQ